MNNSINDIPAFIPIWFLIAENDDDCIDEGIEEGDKRWDDESEEERNNTKDLEHIIEVRKTTLDISTFWQAAVDKLPKTKKKNEQKKTRMQIESNQSFASWIELLAPWVSSHYVYTL